jgi:hypothetical protein
VTIKMAFRPIANANEYRLEVRSRIAESESASIETLYVDPNLTAFKNVTDRLGAVNMPSGTVHRRASKPPRGLLVPSRPTTAEAPNSTLNSTVPTGSPAEATDHFERNVSEPGAAVEPGNDFDATDLPEDSQQMEPNATDNRLDKAYVSWAPLLELFPREAGGSFIRISWTDMNYSATTKFYTVWFRDIDGREYQQLQCLAADDDADSVSPRVPREDSCGTIDNAASNFTGTRRSACHPFWAVEQAATLSSERVSSTTFTISPFSLWAAPSNYTRADWAGLSNVCSHEARSHRIHLFVVACRGDPASPSCDFDKPSRSILVEISCEGMVKRLLLQDDTVELVSSSCIKCTTLEPFGEFCQSSEQSWSDWDCIKDDFGTGCARFTEPMGLLTLSMCDHRNRINVRVVACFDSDCEAASTTDDVFEFEFRHPSGVRAAHCAGKPSAAAAAAGKAVTAIVGGAVCGSVGGSVASSVTGSASAAGSGLIAMIGAVQFAAATSDMCGVQAQPVLLDILSVMQSLNLFNLRIPMPDFSGMPDLAFIEKLPLKEALQLCGVTGDTSLEGQARSEVGDLFTANVLVSMLSLAITMLAHFLILTLIPRRWSARVIGAFPFMSCELFMYLNLNQGLLISSTQLMGIAGDNGLCFFAGLVVLMVPTVFLLSVWYLLFWYVRPSSRAAKVRWNDEEGEWSLNENHPKTEPTDPAVSEDGEDLAQIHTCKGAKRPHRKGKGELELPEARHARVPSPSDPEDARVDIDEHDSDADVVQVVVRRSLSERMLGSMRGLVRSATSRALESIASDFSVRFEPLLVGWHNKRFAWIGPALLLGIEYGLGLAMGFGAVVSCESEQVRCEHQDV